MPFSIYTLKILALAETLHRWIGVLTGLDRANRERIAEYAEAIAATLGRAGLALTALDADDVGTAAAREARISALKELGRIGGYVETLVAVLEHHLDGRKIAGIKRRLESLDAGRLAKEVARDGGGQPRSRRAARLLAAEGYFRALADGLRA
jgi:hypothetical protein